MKPINLIFDLIFREKLKFSKRQTSEFYEKKEHNSKLQKVDL